MKQQTIEFTSEELTGFQELLKANSPEYAKYVEKFVSSHSTDETYTPTEIYEAVAGFVVDEYKISRERFVRPFYPGGDYENYSYAPDAVVVDNPPFSLLKQIVLFYREHGIKFFLFAPSKTMFNKCFDDVCGITTDSSICYGNNASVATGFLTNLESGIARTSPELRKRIEAVKPRKEKPRNSYPRELLMQSMLDPLARNGVEYKITSDNVCRISKLDAGYTLFGDGFLLSKQEAARLEAARLEAARLEAARLKAARLKAARPENAYKLSFRESEIVRILTEKYEDTQ